mmetsp:Transcript_20723/g.38967  ORF Transcript_20723/g.38967 Transcript_20723/m.38967 type:complete len:235 (+) Transcript_20723:239-943(+)|eukprot:CAMPEP_0170191148 /NCGR_PEP_ID=MMETSP0040_2-20121228/50960_1 /TAXON_ID=641309 /ORGANISM="Lotharella oceanica, Strain CCMP622" /LENGTH=234 /DNA_ID=CAMNT_0010439157 /DNA_START=231 /DNA_END=935 /DNA_ORIENTATION=-
MVMGMLRVAFVIVTVFAATIRKISLSIRRRSKRACKSRPPFGVELHREHVKLRGLLIQGLIGRGVDVAILVLLVQNASVTRTRERMGLRLCSRLEQEASTTVLHVPPTTIQKGAGRVATSSVPYLVSGLGPLAAPVPVDEQVVVPCPLDVIVEVACLDGVTVYVTQRAVVTTVVGDVYPQRVRGFVVGIRVPAKGKVVAADSQCTMAQVPRFRIQSDNPYTPPPCALVGSISVI